MFMVYLKWLILVRQQVRCGQSAFDLVAIIMDGKTRQITIGDPLNNPANFRNHVDGYHGPESIGAKEDDQV